MFVEEKKEGEVRELDAASNTLLKAATLIEKYGLAKGTLKDKEDRLCMLGAIFETSGPIDWFYDAPSPSNTAWKRLRIALAMHDPCTWNNAPERTAAEVIAKLRTVALLV